MENAPSESSYLDLFEYEEASLANLKVLISIPVGYNSAKGIDPWHQSLTEIEIDFPKWYF
jgi:hypothetical protein